MTATDAVLTAHRLLRGGLWAKTAPEDCGFFIGHWPADTTTEQISRTVGADHVVDELVMSFTHDMVMNAVLPGVPPTGRRVRLAVCVVAGFADGKLTHEHIYWDQASLLVQVGLLDPAGLPVLGAEQAEKLLAPRAIPANALLGEAWANRPKPGE